jgi:integrase
MRKSEILKLTRDRIDFERGVIRLRPEDTKTQEGQLVPVTKELSETLRNATIYLHAEGHRVPYVFTCAGKCIGSVCRAFETACREAGISGVVFHDRRHTFITNMRRASVDYFCIMAIIGHKTMSAFKRYHTIDHQDLHQAIGQLDTYMDTNAAASDNSSPHTLKTKHAPVAQADRARDS